MTRTGTDDLGKVALERLKESGADVTHATFDSVKPTGVTVLLPHGKEPHITYLSSTMSEMTVADIDLEYLKSSRHFHLRRCFCSVV